MTEKLKQSLSAAMDDEADAFELRRVLDELGRDPELRSLWDRYHMIGSALRGEPVQVPAGLREGIWRALDDTVAAAEPAPDEGVGIMQAADHAVASVVPHSRMGRYTALAVAASVAFAVVLAFSGLWGGNGQPPADLAQSGNGSPAVLVGPPAPASDARPATASQVHLGSRVSASDVQRAQAYILHHAQQQALNQGGVMSFVKLAAYEAP